MHPNPKCVDSELGISGTAHPPLVHVCDLASPSVWIASSGLQGEDNDVGTQVRHISERWIERDNNGTNIGGRRAPSVTRRSHGVLCNSEGFH